jgi:hypothetical protein
MPLCAEAALLGLSDVPEMVAAFRMDNAGRTGRRNQQEIVSLSTD